MILLCSCNFLHNAHAGNAHPTNGVWYCDELKMTIDFSLFGKTNNMVKLYDESGNYAAGQCDIGFYYDIYISSGDEMLIVGTFEKYQGDKFIITEEDNKYTFYLVNE